MDPRDWTNRVVDTLWERDNRRLNDHLREIIEANAKKGNPACGFLFGGAFHTELSFADRRTAEKKILHPDLHTAGRAYLEDIKRTDNEKTRLLNGVGVLLQGCSSLQDVRDALPDTVVALFPELSCMSRLREDGYPFRDKPLQAHNYKTTSEILSFYVANQLLY